MRAQSNTTEVGQIGQYTTVVGAWWEATESITAAPTGRGGGSGARLGPDQTTREFHIAIDVDAFIGGYTTPGHLVEVGEEEETRPESVEGCVSEAIGHPGVTPGSREYIAPPSWKICRLIIKIME